jgi:hypothetical protein
MKRRAHSRFSVSRGPIRLTERLASPSGIQTHTAGSRPKPLRTAKAHPVRVFSALRPSGVPSGFIKSLAVR